MAAQAAADQLVERAVAPGQPVGLAAVLADRVAAQADRVAAQAARVDLEAVLPVLLAAAVRPAVPAQVVRHVEDRANGNRDGSAAHE